jgi:hypothetical protein
MPNNDESTRDHQPGPAPRESPSPDDRLIAGKYKLL